MAQSSLYNEGVGDEVDVTDDSGRELGIVEQVRQDIGTTPDQPLDVSDATVTVTDDTTFNVNRIGTATPVDDSTTATGSANAAQVSTGNYRSSGTVSWDVSGAATITVEGSNDGGSNWYVIDEFNPGSAEVNGEPIRFAFDDIRAYADANLNELNVAAKGI